MIARLMIALTLVVFQPAAAASQQQTPEGAQRFLVATLGGAFFFYSGDETRHRIGLPATGGECETTIPLAQMSHGKSDTWNQSLEWGSITEVRQEEPDGERIFVRTMNPALSFTFQMGSRTLAARTAFAMEFLRQHCDAAADTGF